MKATLYYVHDPMCSWCWAFQPVWKEIQTALPDELPVKLILGGLAPDSDAPMPEDMQQFLQQTWKKIQTVVPGTQFNFDFWTKAQPRRSTYPACRAIIAVKKQNTELEGPMINAIQNAYYLEAKNPSDADTLISLANTLGLDSEQFSVDLNATDTQQELNRQILFHQQLNSQGFPSLILSDGTKHHYIATNYIDPKFSINAILNLIELSSR